MATEFNPGGSIKRDSAARDSINPPTTPAPERYSGGTIVAIAAVAVVMAIGMFFSVRNATTTASTDVPAITTGSSTAPSPSNPPPAPGPKGQGSN